MEFCNFKSISHFFLAVAWLIMLSSLGVWVKVIVTELILYKKIIVSYQLLFECVLSDYFAIKETNLNQGFMFLCSKRHDKLYIFLVLQVTFCSSFISNINFNYATII